MNFNSPDNSHNDACSCSCNDGSSSFLGTFIFDDLTALQFRWPRKGGRDGDSSGACDGDGRVVVVVVVVRGREGRSRFRKSAPSSFLSDGPLVLDHMIKRTLHNQIKPQKVRVNRI